MAQIRFQIGVPGAGSAARDAEESRERLRRLRPQAGSAARQAEDARRADEPDATPRPARLASIRVQSRAGQTGVASREAGGETVRFSPKNEETSAISKAIAPYPEEAAQAEKPVAQIPGGDANVLPHPTPLQTAAARVRSLLRSVFSEPAA